MWDLAADRRGGETAPRAERSTVKRAALWVFERVGTFRSRLIQRAGRLTRPQNVLTLTCSGNQKVAHELTSLLSKLGVAI